MDICARLAFIAFFLALSLGFAQPISLHAPATVPIQSSIDGFVSADFNGDGKPDIALLSGGNISVFLGKGDATFQAPRVIPAPGACLASGDINADGKADLIVSSPAGTSVLLGNGDGTFVPPIQSASGGCPLVVGDFNSDGKLDIAWIVPALMHFQVGVQLGTGDGHFNAANLSDFVVASSLVTGDFNHDGKLDIALGLAYPMTGTFGVMFGRGDGTFSELQQFGSPVDGTTQIVAADFNQDGFLDLATTSNVGDRSDLVGIYVFLGNGEGSFQQVYDLVTGSGGLLAAGDLNGDGKPDLIAGEAYLLGNSDGTFVPPLFISQADTSCMPTGTNAYCYYSNQVAVIADFNQDSLPDIAVATLQGLYSDNELAQNYSFSVLLQGSGMPRFAATGVSAASFQEPVTTGSLASAFGSELAATKASAQAPPWPTSLGGIELRFRDYQGMVHLAPLLFVSPDQINYQVPADIPSGVASITVNRVGSPIVESGQAINVSYDGAPSFFTVNSEGLAAATAVRVHPDGTQTPVPVYSCPGTSPCKALPIDVSGDPVILSLYGTGFVVDTVAVNNSMECKFNGQGPIYPAYFGPQGQYPGLDQANLALSAVLAGSGDIAIYCQLDAGPGAPSNLVHVTIQ